jgi:hypothetical protein
MSGVRFTRANLDRADLSRADLTEASFDRTQLRATRFAETLIGETTFVATDLSAAIGLQKVQHAAPSNFDDQTVRVSLLNASGNRRNELSHFFQSAGLSLKDFDRYLRLGNTPRNNPSNARQRLKYDVFISHAWEDKDAIAHPLADELRRRGLDVWYDDFSLKVGDHLRESIDKGLGKSRFGVVILSPHFFAKQWPQYELDGLVAEVSLAMRM